MRLGVDLFVHVDTPDLTETVTAHTPQFVNQIDRDDMLSSRAAVLVFDTWQDVSLLLDNFTTDCLVCGVIGQSKKGSIVTGWWKEGMSPPLEAESNALCACSVGQKRKSRLGSLS